MEVFRSWQSHRSVVSVPTIPGTAPETFVWLWRTIDLEWFEFYILKYFLILRWSIAFYWQIIHILKFKNHQWWLIIFFSSECGSLLRETFWKQILWFCLDYIKWKQAEEKKIKLSTISAHVGISSYGSETTLHPKSETSWMHNNYTFITHYCIHVTSFNAHFHNLSAQPKMTKNYDFIIKLVQQTNKQISPNNAHLPSPHTSRRSGCLRP